MDRLCVWGTEFWEDFQQMKKGVVKWRTVWGRKKKSKERRKGAERFSVAELLNCPFSKAPQPQNLSRGNPQGHRRIRDGEREKTRDERSASLNRLEENIVTLISPSLILTPNVGAINWEDVEHILPAGIAGLGKRVGFSIQTVVCPDSTWWKWMQF
ncbi:hypothetical protein QQF64_024840 [Cirrhinus molitorella]|uniref:Uncharacterized protein n=1 Tax=Cirrhinus molitorella TaxID=172907 RepID=A0ABR3NMN5_9TELE